MNGVRETQSGVSFVLRLFWACRSFLAFWSGGVEMRKIVVLYFVAVGLLFAVANELPDWTKTKTHLDETLKTLNLIDNGIAEVEGHLKKNPEFRTDVVGLHQVRAEYLNTRVMLLYHLHTLTPPRDFYGDENE